MREARSVPKSKVGYLVEKRSAVDSSLQKPLLAVETEHKKEQALHTYELVLQDVSQSNWYVIIGKVSHEQSLTGSQRGRVERGVKLCIESLNPAERKKNGNGLD